MHVQLTCQLLINSKTKKKINNCVPSKTTENQHEMEDKRLKLDYEDVIACVNVDEWTEILARCEEYAQNAPNNESPGNFDCFGTTQNYNLIKYSSFLNSAVTPSEFAVAVQGGCPKNRRGEIWCLLANIRQKNGVRPVCSPAEASVDFGTNYRVLLQQLTSQQHAILVDLGECSTVNLNSD